MYILTHISCIGSIFKWPGQMSLHLILLALHKRKVYFRKFFQKYVGTLGTIQLN